MSIELTLSRNGILGIKQSVEISVPFKISLLSPDFGESQNPKK